MYTVRRPINTDFIDRPEVCGVAISKHRTQANAERAIASEQRMVRRGSGALHNFVQRYVTDAAGKIVYRSGC